MRTAQDVYTHYRINRGLQLHQLRVAFVGLTVARAQQVPVDERRVVLACLFHDMGNILKSDLVSLGAFTELFEPEGVEYWRGVQNEFRELYGKDEHEATTSIARDFGLDEQALDLIQGMGFSKADEVLRSGSREQMIVEYADQRVMPFGIASMDERLSEGRKRYAHRGEYGESDAERFEMKLSALKRIEELLFLGTDITPQSITEEQAQKVLEELRRYPLA